MSHVFESIAQAIGQTPLVRLQSITAGLGAKVYVKVEGANPGGSVKDRVALAMILEAEARGDLRPGGTVVAATAGGAGAGLALLSAARGYRCVLVVTDKQSEEERATLRAYGAQVLVTPAAVEPHDPRSCYRVARRVTEETPGAFCATPAESPMNPRAHYEGTGPELLAQLEDGVDLFVTSLATGGTLSGVGRFLKEHSPDTRVVGVDPVGSIYYDYFQTGQLTAPFAYALEGIGSDFLPTTMSLDWVDDVVRVNDKESLHMTRRLAREEGLFCGGASGAALAGALKVLQHQDLEGKTVVVLLPDSGARSLSKVFDDKWMEENGFLEAPIGLGTVRDVLDAMGPRDIVTAPDTLRVTEAIGLMKLHGISQLPVLRDGRILGIIHERKLLEQALKSSPVSARTADLADSNYCTLGLDTEVSVVSDLFRKVRVGLVMDDGALVGVLTRIDIIDHVARVTAGGTP